MALNFDLTEEQNLTRQAVRDFAEKEIAPVVDDLDEKEEFSVELTRKMGELGLLGCFVPEKYGGSNMGYISYIIAVEELARVDGSQADRFITSEAKSSGGNGSPDFAGAKCWRRSASPNRVRVRTRAVPAPKPSCAGTAG
jgi:hypothetical protein